MKNQDIKRQFFQTLNSFHVYVFFRNGESALLVAFVKYTLSKLYNHCNQNCNFFAFLGTLIFFVAKGCSISF